MTSAVGKNKAGKGNREEWGGGAVLEALDD